MENNPPLFDYKPTTKKKRKKPVYTDSSINHEAVKLYRDTFNLTPNPGWRRDIIVSVEAFGMKAWRQVIWNWKRMHYDPNADMDRKWNPQNISGMLQELERKNAK